MQQATAVGEYVAPYAVVKINIVSVVLLFRSVLTPEAIALQIKKSVPDTNAKLKFLNEKWKSNRPVLTLDKRIELLEIQMLLHSPLFSLAQHRRWIDRSYHARPSVIAAPLPHPTGVPLEQDELTVTEQVDFSSLFGSPLTFLAFLAEVMKETILAKDKRDN